MPSLDRSESSSNVAPSPTPSSQPKSQNDVRINILAIVLGIVGILLVGVIIFATLRMKRRRSAKDNDGSESFVSPPQGRTIDRSHPAARITPFGSPCGETPRFKHTPGSDMRIAVRRPDGAWDFADPREPFTPSGVSDIDVLPSPSSSTAMLPPKTRVGLHKEHDSKASREIHMGYDRDYDIEANPPPPAYGYDSGGYIRHSKS